MKPKILIAAGGTGGHLFPAQQLCEQLKSENCEVFFAGHKLALSPFFEKEKIPFQEIASAPLKKLIPFLSASWKGFWQSFRLIRSFKPDAVVGFGSFHSFPVLLAAAFLRKKIVLFEANCLLGKVNRLFLPSAQKIAIQFPIGKKSPGKQVFVPLLPWKAVENSTMLPQEARKTFGLQPDLFTILVFGGSQGASFLNEVFCQTALLLKQKGLSFQVIHLTGKNGKAFYEGTGIPACIKPFEKEMPLAYAAADIAVCRSGAGTLAELIRFAKPAVLIPYPYAADDHQKVNGKFLSETLRGGRLLSQNEASPERLGEKILMLKNELELKKTALQKAGSESEGRTDFASVILNAIEREGGEAPAPQKNHRRGAEDAEKKKRREL